MTWNKDGVAGNLWGHNVLDDEGNPAGGEAHGIGFDINYQNGPLGRDEDRKPANGAFVEDVLEAVVQRIRFYQYGYEYPQDTGPGKFACEENEAAIEHLEQALRKLRQRTHRREKAGVEGTHQGN